MIPELRNFFAVYGYELYYHDCHLETDAISDNHNLEAICLEILNRTIQQNRNENGINYIVCMKYALFYRLLSSVIR